MASILFSNCSNGVTLATYSDGKKNHSVTIGDVKEDVLKYLNFYPNIAGDVNWNKDFVFNARVLVDLIYFEEIKSGLTNSADFQSFFNSTYQKQYLLDLFKKGEEALKNPIEKAKYEVVKASHILLTANKMTNINGQTKELSEKDFQKVLADTAAKASSIVAQLKSSPRVETEFSNVASVQSQDYASARNGGDLGYFTKGMMVKEFEDAAFSKETKGLIDQPVKTSYGYHIIYVHQPKKKMNAGEIKSAAGTDNYSRIEPNFKQTYYKSDANNLKELYTLNTSNNTVGIGSKTYSINQIPDDAKILEVFGKTYTWKDAKDIILIYIPDFDEKLDAQNFDTQMGNLKYFVYHIEAAKKYGADKVNGFSNEQEKKKQDLLKRSIVQNFEKAFTVKAKETVTDEAIRNQYLSNKAVYTKEEKGKKITLSFKDAETRIRSELENAAIQKAFESWKTEIISKYKVTYNDNGFNALANLEKQELKKIENKRKKMEEQRKKEEKKRNQPQQMKVLPQTSK
jgi:hypothetical protein